MISWAVPAAILLSSIAVAAMPMAAQAKTTRAHGASGHTHASRFASRHHRNSRYAGISCVPFARAESGIVLTGNAATWWDEAEGRYARGSAPEAGSVLNFRANAAMHLGHVAVVKDVLNARQIDIDQANWWGPGGGHGVVSRDISVIDVSPHNDWTAVRVALGHSGAFGSVYPTYGFIYQRPDGSAAAPQQYAAVDGTSVLNPAPRDLRPRGQRGRLADVRALVPGQYDEVAETPAESAAGPLSLDATDHSLR
jgi:surface antigen